MSMQRCSYCNEPIVRKSEVPRMCMCCYHVLDMGRYKERKPRTPEDVACSRCRDTGRVLERRDAGNPTFLIVVPCPNCSKEE